MLKLEFDRLVADDVDSDQNGRKDLADDRRPGGARHPKVQPEFAFAHKPRIQNGVGHRTDDIADHRHLRASVCADQMRTADRQHQKRKTDGGDPNVFLGVGQYRLGCAKQP